MATTATTATVSEKLPSSASSCSSVRILRCFRQSGCRGSRPELPLLSSFYSQSDRRNSLVCVSPPVGTAKRFCSAVNSCQRSASDLLLSARASRAPRHITLPCCFHVFCCSCPCAEFRLGAVASVYKSHSLPGAVRKLGICNSAHDLTPVTFLFMVS